MPQASGALTWSFTALAVLFAGAFVAALEWAERRAGWPPDARRARVAVAAALSAG